MEKLTFNDFKEKTDLMITQELFKSISGGTENDCHDTFNLIDPEKFIHKRDNTRVAPPVGR